MVQKLFTQPTYCDRPWKIPVDSNTYDEIIYKQFGKKVDLNGGVLGHINGQQWRYQRKMFVHHVLAAVDSKKLEKLQGYNVQKS